MVIIGVDLGLTGAIAAVDARGSCVVEDLPIVADGAGKRIDGRALILLIRQFVPAGEAASVIAEDVRPRIQGNKGAHFNSQASQSSLSISRGIVQCACDIARLEVKYIQPQTWKRFYALIGKDKDLSRQCALGLYPVVAHRLARKKDQNRAESILLAHWGQRTLA